MDFKEKNLIIILGPTGVGKSLTSIKLAKKLQGEIINCDSMQVYKGFDIGTDKLLLDKRESIPHHLLDIIEPSTQFTAADFAELSLKAISHILKKKKLPIIVGGTGLYLKALLDGLFPGPGRNSKLRQKLEKRASEEGLDSMRKKLREVDHEYSQKIGKKDKMRIIRALEVFYLTQKPITEHFLKTESFVKDFNIIIIGLKLNRKELYKRIEERVDKMFKRGIINEVEALLEKGANENSPPFRALGYKYVLKFLKNEMSLEEAISLTKRDTRRYAKRQFVWFKKMKGIQWFSPYDFSSLANYVKKNLK
ncbi:MAG: tRNA (adenosine(37)-N6)-dimethylallyltransferase MiaA [Candidatus Aminicenantaceae bacterium]